MNTFAVDTKVKWTNKHIKDWVLSNDNWSFFNDGVHDTCYSELDYDQEVMLAMFMLMKVPVWGNVKGYGADSDTVLVYFNAAGCSYWGYEDVKNLVQID